MGRVMAAAVLLLAACTGRESMSPEESADRVVDNVAYRAETAVLESFPVQLRTKVTLTNTGAGAAEVTFPDGCVVLLRAYRTAARTGEPAWDQSREAICTMALIQATLAPGESRAWETSVSAAEILGDSLPNGTYYFSAFIRPDGRGMELPAGSAELAQ